VGIHVLSFGICFLVLSGCLRYAPRADAGAGVLVSGNFRTLHESRTRGIRILGAQATLTCPSASLFHPRVRPQEIRQC
jgi:hypothetical protein